MSDSQCGLCLVWSSVPVTSRKNAVNNTENCTWYLLTWLKPLTVWTESFHHGIESWTVDAGGLSDPVTVLSGTKQGCVLAPLLFNLYYATMLLVAFRRNTVSVDIYYHTDGGMFNIRRLQTPSKVHQRLARDLLYADDFALVAAGCSGRHWLLCSNHQVLQSNCKHLENWSPQTGSSWRSLLVVAWQLMAWLWTLWITSATWTACYHLTRPLMMRLNSGCPKPQIPTQETPLSPTNRATHFCHYNGVADLPSKRAPPHRC